MGQTRRLAFLRGIVATEVREIKFLILDEVTAGLDKENAKRLNGVVASLQEKYQFLVLFTSHDPDCELTNRSEVHVWTVAIDTDVVGDIGDSLSDSPDENTNVSWLGKVRRMISKVYGTTSGTGSSKKLENSSKNLPRVRIVGK